MTGLAASLAQSSESILLALGDIGFADLSNGLGGSEVLDGEGGLDAGGVSVNRTLGGEGLGSSSNFFGRCVELLVLAALAGEEDQSALVLLETSDIGGKRFLGDILAAVVDGDADCGSELAGNASLLCIKSKYSFIYFLTGKKHIVNSSLSDSSLSSKSSLGKKYPMAFPRVSNGW